MKEWFEDKQDLLLYLLDGAWCWVVNTKDGIAWRFDLAVARGFRWLVNGLAGMFFAAYGYADPEMYELLDDIDATLVQWKRDYEEWKNS